MVRFVSEFGADSVPTTAPFIDDELAVHSWPDLDWERIADENGVRPRHVRAAVPADDVRHVRGVAADHAVLPSARAQGADRTAAHVEVPAHRWILLLEPRRPGPDRVVERARPRTGAEGRLRRSSAPRALPSSSSPSRRPTGSIPAAGWVSTCTSSTTCASDIDFAVVDAVASWAGGSSNAGDSVGRCPPTRWSRSAPSISSCPTRSVNWRSNSR